MPCTVRAPCQFWYLKQYHIEEASTAERLLRHHVLSTCEVTEKRRPGIVKRRRNTPDFGITSDDPNVPHHPRFLMFDNVAMKHPVAGIVGNKSDLGPFFRQQQ